LASNVWDYFNTEVDTKTLAEVKNSDGEYKQLNRERKLYYTDNLSEQERMDSLDIERRGRLRTAFIWNTDVIKYMRDYISGVVNPNLSSQEHKFWVDYTLFVERTNLRVTGNYVGVTEPDINGYAYLVDENDVVDYRTCPLDTVLSHDDGIRFQSLDELMISLIDEDTPLVKTHYEIPREPIKCPTDISYTVDDSTATGDATSGSLGYGEESKLVTYIRNFEYHNIQTTDTFYNPHCPVGLQGIVNNCYEYNETSGLWTITATSASSGANPEYLFNDAGKWLADDIQQEHWIQAETSEPTLISRYRITIDLVADTMNDWMVTAWNKEKQAWVLLDRQVNWVWTQDGETKDFLIENRGWYDKIRIRMIGNNTGVYKNDAGSKIVLLNGVLLPESTTNILTQQFCDLKDFASVTNIVGTRIEEAFEAPLKTKNLIGNSVREAVRILKLDFTPDGIMSWYIEGSSEYADIFLDDIHIDTISGDSGGLYIFKEAEEGTHKFGIKFKNIFEDDLDGFIIAHTDGPAIVNQVPEMSKNDETFALASTSTTQGDVNGDPFNAFRDIWEWRGVANAVSSEYLQLQLKNKDTLLDRYYVSSRTNPNGYLEAEEWTMWASNDGISWTIIDTVIGQIEWWRNERREFKIVGNSTRYSYYRMEVTKGEGQVVIEHGVHIRRLELWGN